MIVVDLTAATICFLGSCYPVLYGEATPVGEFQLVKRMVLSEGYGGNVLQFTENETTVYSVHRLWTGNPKQKREKRLKSKTPRDNKITDGCINVDPEVYELIWNLPLEERRTIVIRR